MSAAFVAFNIVGAGACCAAVAARRTLLQTSDQKILQRLDVEEDDELRKTATLASLDDFLTRVRRKRAALSNSATGVGANVARVTAEIDNGVECVRKKRVDLTSGPMGSNERLCAYMHGDKDKKNKGPVRLTDLDICGKEGSYRFEPHHP